MSDYENCDTTEYNDLVITQGQKFTFATYMQIDGAIVPLTGLKARFSILYKDADTPALVLTTENGGIIFTENKIKVTAKTAQTTLLLLKSAIYELELIDSENENIGFLAGDIKIERGIV